MIADAAVRQIIKSARPMLDEIDQVRAATDRVIAARRELDVRREAYRSAEESFGDPGWIEGDIVRAEQAEAAAEAEWEAAWSELERIAKTR